MKYLLIILLFVVGCGSNHAPTNDPHPLTFLFSVAGDSWDCEEFDFKIFFNGTGEGSGLLGNFTWESTGPDSIKILAFFGIISIRWVDISLIDDNTIELTWLDQDGVNIDYICLFRNAV